MATQLLHFIYSLRHLQFDISANILKIRAVQSTSCIARLILTDCTYITSGACIAGEVIKFKNEPNKIDNFVSADVLLPVQTKVILRY
jgi:hypothetical protein